MIYRCMENRHIYIYIILFLYKCYSVFFAEMKNYFLNPTKNQVSNCTKIHVWRLTIKTPPLSRHLLLPVVASRLRWEVIDLQGPPNTWRKALPGHLVGGTPSTKRVGNRGHHLKMLVLWIANMWFVGKRRRVLWVLSEIPRGYSMDVSG